MDKKIQIVAIIAVVTFSVFVLTSPSDLLPLPLPLSASNSESASVSILAENLDKPRAIAISGDRIFVTEQDGFIRVIQNNTLIESPLAVFRSANVFDGGLLGIALHPDFSNNHYIDVFLTYTDDGYLWNKI
ncbi:MAG: PQQ-dependent sugar dehydrogenase, partial [Thaumarchaeota archaeon]|nr:PQQ-dependent sugar dehydrogenase [Nitrososphaerota archaeon]